MTDFDYDKAVLEQEADHNFEKEADAKMGG